MNRKSHSWRHWAESCVTNQAHKHPSNYTSELSHTAWTTAARGSWTLQASFRTGKCESDPCLLIWQSWAVDIQIVEISKVIDREWQFTGEKSHITWLLYLKVLKIVHPHPNVNNVTNATAYNNANADLIYFKVKKHFWHLYFRKTQLNTFVN